MSPLFTYNSKLLVVDGKLATNENCCCDNQACIQIVIPEGGASGGIDWPGLNVSITGDIILFGDYDGVINGFWQGRSETGLEPSAVTLSFNDKKPKKIVVLCTAMNERESQSFTIIGDAQSAIIDSIRPIGAFIEGPIGPNNGTINRADDGLGDSRFKLSIKENTPGSITGFVWSHTTTQNMNGMVNAIFLCENIDGIAEFI